MKYNQLGKSDLSVSEIGFGTMSLPKDENQAIYLVHKAIDSGINFLDTADVYGYGQIEEIVGKAIKNKRDQVILATKGGNHWEPNKEGWFWDPSKAYIKNAFKKSLQRLGTDYIDLYQLHGGTIEDPIDETIEAFEELKQEGFIRYYGISSIRPNVIREYVDRSSIVSVMTQYSMLDRRPEEEMLDLLEKHDVSVIARGPVARGLLSNNGLSKIPDHGYLEYSSNELQAIIPKLREITDQTQNLSQTAIQYSLHHPAVATAIPGASRESQLSQNVDTINTPSLTDDEITKIKHMTKTNQYDKHR